MKTNKNTFELSNSTKAYFRKMLQNCCDLYPASGYIDDDYEEGRYIFEAAITLPTRAFTEKQYYQYTDFIDTLDRTENPKYKVFFSYDISGYNYWTNIMKEDLSVYIRVEIFDNLTMEEVGDLETIIYQSVIQIRDFEDTIYKTDTDYSERLAELD